MAFCVFLSMKSGRRLRCVYGSRRSVICSQGPHETHVNMADLLHAREPQNIESGAGVRTIGLGPPGIKVLTLERGRRPLYRLHDVHRGSRTSRQIVQNQQVLTRRTQTEPGCANQTQTTQKKEPRWMSLSKQWTPDMTVPLVKGIILPIPDVQVRPLVYTYGHYIVSAWPKPRAPETQLSPC